VRPSRILASFCAVIAAGLVAAPPIARADPPAPEPPAPLAGPVSSPTIAVSTTAERVYAAARPRLLQIRTLITAAGRQSSIGSGFLVSQDGLAITNYHVVSQFALEPALYRLEYTAADASTGTLALLAIDLANDLAVVRLDRSDAPFFQFDARAMPDGVPKGERLYSMGNPLNLGFTIVEGTHNGLVERSYIDRLHFSGAINPGMSGGPTVTADGRVVGVNVAKQLGSDLVSFLVPGHFAAELLTHARSVGATPPQDFRAEVGRQLAAWQATLYQRVAAAGFRETSFGPYQAPESTAPWFTCWSQTNSDQVPKPRATINATTCNSETRLFVANDLTTGLISFTHSYIRSVDLNAFQFAHFLSQQNQLSWIGGWSRKWHTPRRCHEDFVDASKATHHPSLRVGWCARAYREFDNLYDIWVMAVTQDSASHVLVSRLNFQAVGYDEAIALTQRLIESVQWVK
jgi:S1-C subfamily serine protease